MARSWEDLAGAVLDTEVKRMKGGLFPNMGAADNPAFNSVDAPLWFFHAIQHYDIDNVEKWRRYGTPMKEVLAAYRNGTSFGIHMRDNGLIYAGEKGKALTWMDAIVDGVPVTPRNGYAVEINALWYNAVCFALECARDAADKTFIKEWSSLPDKIQKSFTDIFWDQEHCYPADFVNDEEGKNMQVRPNMVIAASLDYSMLDTEMMKSVIDLANRVLVTPRGLRSLSPAEEGYHGTYHGSQKQRDAAYHQGTVWPWLIGPFSDAWLKVYGKSGAPYIRKLIYGFEETMTEAGITTISEIYDGDPPHAPKGAISQAWSVAEVYRILLLLKTKFKEK